MKLFFVRHLILDTQTTLGKMPETTKASLQKLWLEILYAENEAASPT